MNIIFKKLIFLYNRWKILQFGKYFILYLLKMYFFNNIPNYYYSSIRSSHEIYSIKSLKIYFYFVVEISDETSLTYFSTNNGNYFAESSFIRCQQCGEQ
jgi:hypothetical protein